MNLYEISQRYKDVLNLMNDEDIDFETLQDTLQSIEDAATVKIDGCIKVLRSLEAQSRAFDTEIERMTKRKTALDNRAKWLKSYIECAMAEMGKDKLTISIGTVGRQKSPPGLFVFNELLIPQNYLITPPIEQNIDKAAIIKDIQAGIEVPGCEINQRYHIRLY